MRLKGFRWIIYQRGFANIVEVDSHDDEKEEKGKEGDYRNQVWGMMYSLEEEDEKLLDEREGVPVAYRKEWIECEFWTVPEAATSSSSSSALSRGGEEEVGKNEDGSTLEEEKKKRKPADITKRPGKEKMLVYINREMTDEGEIRKEYISRMNCGIKDAVKEGLPREYVEQVLRRWIPADGEEGEEEKRVGGN